MSSRHVDSSRDIEVPPTRFFVRDGIPRDCATGVQYFALEKRHSFGGSESHSPERLCFELLE